MIPQNLFVSEKQIKCVKDTMEVFSKVVDAGENGDIVFQGLGLMGATRQLGAQCLLEGRARHRAVASY